MTQQHLPPLPYDFGALEPVISGEIMRLHYEKHHAGYVQNWNVAFEKHQEAEKKGDLEAMLALQGALRFNGGGHINHSIFWSILCPPSKADPSGPKGEMAKWIERDFGSFSALQEKFSSMTTAIQGSGWGWVGFSKEGKKLVMATCPNQDPLSGQGLIPLFGIDVWEHAYYLQYKNVRAEYVKAIWKIFNWEAIEKRFASCVLR